MIAVKREVAADRAGSPWSECQVRNWRQVTVQNNSKNPADMRDVCCPQGGHTRVSVQSPLVVLRKYEKEATFFMASQVMRITLKAYDHQLVDQSAAKIVATVKKNGSKVSGPVPLPTKKEVVTILRAVHKYKDSREQFEQRTHKRLIDVINPNKATTDILKKLDISAGVYLEIKAK